MTDFRNQAIYALSPDGDWMWDDGNLIWCSPNVAQPTQAEIDAKLAELEAAEPLRLLRIERNRILQQSDWMANSDVVMTDEWRAYRQALRDLPETQTPALDDNGNLINVEWPTPPGETSVS